MKKLILSFAVIAIASLGASAQSNLKFGIGVDGQLPIGDFNDAYKIGFGGSVKANYSLDATLDLTLSAGYISFSGKDIPNTNLKYANFDMIPVLAGIEYNFGASKVYASAQLGAGFGTKSGSKTAFAYAPGVGYKFTPNLDLLLKYTGYSYKGGTNSTVGLRLGYTFGQGK
ncbi:outer membrane beta-barrel protein [Ferruginibacter sp. HRS2-29]|uniref:outer membrane beta-barrel protein n=1 Tax=Ferruginibacter sp. HRS2-29 TaxID=2487334 RepID=UPI0020CD4BD7|nr:outer membrane beta-barrel protein [Ferruginibacter sp. HRS2-29]